MCFGILVLSTLIAGSVGAESATFVADNVQKKYETIKTLEADFVQVALSMGMNKGRVSSGKVQIKKPGKMKWVFKTPEEDVIVSNGTSMWIYQKDLNQVIESKIEANTPQVAMNFLAGAGNMEKDFKVELIDTTSDSYELRLSPKKSIPHVNEIILLVDKKTFVVIKTTVKDAFGGQTSVEIKNIKTNREIKDKVFEFTPPKGVTVINP